MAPKGKMVTYKIISFEILIKKGSVHFNDTIQYKIKKVIYQLIFQKMLKHII